MAHRALCRAHSVVSKICNPQSRLRARMFAVRSSSEVVCPGYEEGLERNWCGNVRYHGTPAQPNSEDELQAIVKSSAGPVRVAGSGHSFSPIAECAGGISISLRGMRGILSFTPPSASRLGSITIEGGATYTDVIQFLGNRGALRNLPSCPQFTVAGAIATGTHGSGLHIQNLAADVAAIEFVLADGSLRMYSREETPDILKGCSIHLGCLGVVSKITLDVVPFYEVESFRYENVPLEPVINALPELWESCDSLSVWSSGYDKGIGAGLCWVVFRYFSPHWQPTIAAPVHRCPPEMNGALRQAAVIRYCSDGSLSMPTTGKRPWHDALTQTMENAQETMMVATDLQAEFFVPLSEAQAAIRATREVAKDWEFSPPQGFWQWSAADNKYVLPEGGRGLVDAMEFRQIKGDSAWLSPQPVDSLGIHISFSSQPERYAEVQKVLPRLETALRQFGARAHWGKLAPLTFAPGSTRQLYGEGLNRFRELCRAHDPKGKFLNAHLRQMLFVDVDS